MLRCGTRVAGELDTEPGGQRSRRGTAGITEHTGVRGVGARWAMDGTRQDMITDMRGRSRAGQPPDCGHAEVCRAHARVGRCVEVPASPGHLHAPESENHPGQQMMSVLIPSRPGSLPGSACSTSRPSRSGQANGRTWPGRQPRTASRTAVVPKVDTCEQGKRGDQREYRLPELRTIAVSRTKSDRSGTVSGVEVGQRTVSDFPSQA
jgi:hypothetical protein